MKTSFHSKDIGEEAVVKRRKFNARLKKIGVILVLSFILLGLVFYWMPKPVEKAFYACTTEGEVINVEFHLYWQPLLFSPSKLKGYIILDNEYFYSPFGYRFDGKINSSISRSLRPFTFKETWKIKREGDRYMPVFMQGDAQGNVYTEVKIGFESCRVFARNKKFDPVEIHWWNAEESKAFFGPAQTIEEVYAILAELLQ